MEHASWTPDITDPYEPTIAKANINFIQLGQLVV